ncbi:MAG: hypothetical protein ACYC6C_13590 [Coriobacteriia bacterium]
MAQDFVLAVTAGASVSTWQDPANPGVAASRLHSRAGHPELRHVGTVGTQIEITATVAGVAAPMDAALGGRLFQAWRIENPAWPGTGFYSPITPYVFGFTSPAGQSSVQRFTPRVEGHYTVGVRRQDGGSMLLHFDVGP